MIVGREQLIVLEEFAKKQERIYPDACDYGYRWIEGRIGMQEVHRLRQAVVELMGISSTSRCAGAPIGVAGGPSSSSSRTSRTVMGTRASW